MTTRRNQPRDEGARHRAPSSRAVAVWCMVSTCYFGRAYRDPTSSPSMCPTCGAPVAGRSFPSFDAALQEARSHHAPKQRQILITCSDRCGWASTPRTDDTRHRPTHCLRCSAPVETETFPSRQRAIRALREYQDHAQK